MLSKQVPSWYCHILTAERRGLIHVAVLFELMFTVAVFSKPFVLYFRL